MANSPHIKDDQIFYKLFDKKSGRLLGLFYLEQKVELEDFDYNGTHNTDANLTICMEFTPYDDLNIRNHHSYFQACYLNKPFVNIGPRASISTHNPFNIGGIELNPAEIRGQRVGSFIMAKVVEWLKQFPHDTAVHPIDFVPSGSKDRAAAFYRHAGVPVNGDAFNISDLKVTESWKQNIHSLEKSALIIEIIGLKQELDSKSVQIEHLKNQISQISKIQYTNNFFVGFKSYSVVPANTEILPVDIDTSTWPTSDQGLVELYIDTAKETEKYRDQYSRLMKVIQEFNDYKRPENRWRNAFFALQGLVSSYKNIMYISSFILLFYLLKDFT